MPSPPWLETGLLLLAGSTLGILLGAPQTPWLAPVLRPWALTLSAVWTVWRAMALDRALAHRRAWSRSVRWQLDPIELPHAARRSWWRRW
jgi:hypothetical protein